MRLPKVVILLRTSLKNTLFQQCVSNTSKKMFLEAFTVDLSRQKGLQNSLPTLILRPSLTLLAIFERHEQPILLDNLAGVCKNRKRILLRFQTLEYWIYCFSAKMSTTLCDATYDFKIHAIVLWANDSQSQTTYSSARLQPHYSSQYCHVDQCNHRSFRSVMGKIVRRSLQSNDWLDQLLQS